MTAYDVMFLFFAAAALLSGVMMILSPSPVASAMSLVMVFVFTAGLYVLLQAFFLAAIQILVYAGAIMVLFLFVIMLLDLRERQRWWVGNGLGLLGGPLLGLAFAAAVATTLRRTHWPETDAGGLLRGELAQVAGVMFSHYLLPVEIVTLVLLGAMVGVVALNRREERA
jgi:NADH-quinone oxidoreductase subunit J